MIDIGIDESMSAPDPRLIVSAIVGKTAPMRSLDTEWKRELKRSGVDYFHAKDHWNMSAKPYHGIQRDDREKLLDRLIGHLHHRFLFAVSSIVDETDYLDNTSDRFRSQYGSPYAFAFQMVMTCVYCELIRQGKENQPVNILIEDGHKNSQQAMGFIADKKTKSGGLTIGTYGLGGKLNNPILQAADMLAFGVCEFHTKGQSDLAAKLTPPKVEKKILQLRWSRSSVQSIRKDIIRNIRLKKADAPGSKRLSELVMW